MSPSELPLIAECRLDLSGLREQRDRYRALGRDLVGLDRADRRLEATFSAGLDTELLEQTIEVERGCCPFFEMSFDPGQRRLSIRVQDPEQDPALDALRYALTEAG